MFRISRSFVSSALLSALLLLTLTGCGIGTLAPASGPALQTPIGTIKGQVFGGQTPIIGARVFLFAAGTSGYGGNGIAASTTNASTSLMTSYTTGSYPTAQDTVSTSPTYLDYYETTDANGAFNLTSEYTCTPGTQVYLYTVGGQPTTGTTNANAANMAVLGQCPSTDTFAGTISYIFINEISTVATAYAMAGFATDALHVGSSGTTLAQTGIANAFANANQLYNIQTNNGARTTTPGGNGTVPSGNIMALANSLAGCVNSSGSTSGACVTILGIKSAGSTGTTPTDTATAAINIAHNPAYNVSSIYSAASTSPPYVTGLTAPPTDWTIGLQFTGGGLSSTKGIAIDGSGNAWLANFGSNTVTEFSSKGVALTGSSGLSVNGSGPEGLAIDPSGNVWTANYNSSNLSKISNAGVFLLYGSGVNRPLAVAIDGSSNVWAVNVGSGSVGKLSSSGASIYTAVNGGLNGPFAVAVDGSANVWAASTNAAALAEFSSAGPALSGSGYTGGGLSTSAIVSLAVDSTGNVWSANYTTNRLSRFANSGTAVSNSGYTGGGMRNPIAVEIDGAGSAWVLNNSSTAVLSCFSSAGTAITGTSGYGGGSGGVSGPLGIAIDGSGNVWVANTSATYATEYIGLAAPVITPISAGLSSTPSSGGTSNLGNRP